MIGFFLSRVGCIYFGMMIPAFKTYQALKNEENTAEWSQYWIVWTVFSAAEVVLDSLLFWFPLYYELKLGLVLWLSLAKFKGAQIVYDSYISAVLSTHETLIDDFLTKSEQTARRESAKHLKRAIQGFRQLLLKTLMEQEAPKKQDDKVEKHVQTQPSLESNDAERARRRKKQSSSQPALEKSPDKTALPPLKKA